MNNIDKAGQVIYDEASQAWERGEILTAAGEAERIAKALADAGLLAPDLPEPKEMDEELAPIPKPKDCKEEDVYRAKMDYNGQRGFGVAVRCNPEDYYTPWSVTLDDGDHWWVDDSAVTLLARLAPDREVQA